MLFEEREKPATGNAPRRVFASYQTGVLFALAKGAVTFFLTALLVGVASYIAGHANYKEFKKSVMFRGLLLLPFFLALQYPIDVKTLFSKSIPWVKIAHGENKK